MSQTDYLHSALEDGDLLDIQNFAEPVMSLSQSLCELGLRFLLNLVACWIIVRLLYYPKSRRRDYVFTFMAFSSAMLLLLYAMGRVDVGVGLTLGLFAIFGVIRYRTETVPIREMTYLFVIIAIAAVNGLTPLYRLLDAGESSAHYGLWVGDLSIAVCANALAVALVAILENSRALKSEASKVILYDRIDLVTPDRRDELVEDIRQRLGIEVTDVEIGNVDLLKDSAYIKVYFKPADGERFSSIDSIVKNRHFFENKGV